MARRSLERCRLSLNPSLEERKLTQEKRERWGREGEGVMTNRDQNDSLFLSISYRPDEIWICWLITTEITQAHGKPHMATMPFNLRGMKTLLLCKHEWSMLLSHGNFECKEKKRWERSIEYRMMAFAGRGNQQQTIRSQFVFSSVCLLTQRKHCCRWDSKNSTEVTFRGEFKWRGEMASIVPDRKTTRRKKHI